jgi:hypothetical protein
VLFTLLAWIALETRLSPLVVLGIYPVLALASLIWARGLAERAGRQFCGSFFWPHDEGAPHAPLSAVDGHLVAERWDRAEALLRDLCRRYPQDPAVWTRRIRLAWRQPVDVQRSRAAHRAALAVVVDPAERERIDRLWVMLAESRLADQSALEDELRALEDRCARWVRHHAAREKRKKRAPIRLPFRRTEWSNRTNLWASVPHSRQLNQRQASKDRGQG